MKIKQWWAAHKPSKRRLIQLYAALLFNANIKGFAEGRIYKGPVKNVCAPGLNCYSCPGAVGACPLGSLQNALSTSGKTAPYYVVGILLLYAILFGRWICGFLCPFGLIQDLIHKIKTPKVKKSRLTRALSYLKYVILVFFVVLIPLLYNGIAMPGFCKYICPAGTLEGAVGLLSNPANTSLMDMLGGLFTWKFLLLVAFLAACIFIYRFFCRFICPLGALYGLFNRFSLVGVKLDRDACTDCGLCVGKCKVDIRHVGDHECIQCGGCIDVCPTGAIQWKGPKILLPPQAIGGDIATKGGAATETLSDAADAQNAGAEKARKRYLVTRIAVGILMVGLLGGALYYFNFVDGKADPGETETVTETTDPSDTSIESGEPAPVPGNQVGNLCPGMELECYNNESGRFNLEENRGKVTVINFWGTWCAPCKEELPHFDAVARDYADRGVSVMLVHSGFISSGDEHPRDYIPEKYPDTPMISVQDIDDGGDGAYYAALGGRDTFPMTLIVDADGVITFIRHGKLSHEELVAAVEDALRS